MLFTSYQSKRRSAEEHLSKLSKLARYYSLLSTTAAGSGHLTSSLSAADIMTILMFGGFFHYDLKRPDYPNNDRLIFSKGHASPLFYALWAAAGVVSERDLKTMRQFKSRLEGHPTMRFRYTEAATGSLGQGLSIGVGMALAAKYLTKLPYRTFVLLGDSEMAEGSVWEAIQSAAYYKLNNLVGIIDVNRLGQRGETMYGHDVARYKEMLAAHGWEPIIADGHSLSRLAIAFREACMVQQKPAMIIARTVKGKGVSFLEDKNGWHGKALSDTEFKTAVRELGQIDKSIRGTLLLPQQVQPAPYSVRKRKVPRYRLGETIATRKAYGEAITALHVKFPAMVVLDGEVSNSTYAEIFRDRYPKRFFEMFVAEQNMVGAAVGLSRRGFKPFVSTFAAFFTRAFDQIRMAGYSEVNITFVGSHAGVSIGEDGASQMGLEDIAQFRAIQGSAVLYPADAVATLKLVSQAARREGITYLRTTRAATPVIYSEGVSFPVGGSKVIRRSESDIATVVGAGITLHEALKAHAELHKKGIAVRVIDLYSVKPVDVKTLREAARETGHLIIVEDHVPEGGIGEAVRSALANTPTKITHLAVMKMPRSGKPEELLDYERISAQSIIDIIKRIKKIT